MTWMPIDDEMPYDGGPLPALLGRALHRNLQYCAENRMKKFSLTYYGTVDDVVETDTPPETDETLAGTLGVTGNGIELDPSTIGLQFSSPPSQPVCIPPIVFPLSANARTLRVTLNMRVEDAPVEVYGYVRIGDYFSPYSVNRSYWVRSNGYMSYHPYIKDSASYVEVGTDTPADSDSTYVTLEISVAGLQGLEDLGYAPVDPNATTSVCELFLTFLSHGGEFIQIRPEPTLNFQNLTDISFDGTRVRTNWAWDEYQSNGFSPATMHAHMGFGSIGGQYGRARHVLQARPSDPDDLDNSFVDLVIWPPISDRDNRGPGDQFYTVKAGKVTLFSVSVEETVQDIRGGEEE